MVGVEQNDVLNIRSQADFRAPKTGSIPPGAQDVQNLGCKGGLTYQEFTTLSEAQKQQILKQRPRWCRVRYKGQTGWVAGRYLREGRCLQQQDGAHHGQHDIDPLNHAYRVEGEKVFLRNGHARKPVPDSSAAILSEAVLPAAYGDLNGDGREDAAIILLQQTGGTGTFYYLAVAIHGSDAIEAFFLGDRIAMRKLSIENKTVLVEYLDRAAGEAMATRPTKRVLRRFAYNGKAIKAV